MKNKGNSILIIILLAEIILGMTYLAGFYRGMETCREIYSEGGIKQNDRL